MYSNGILRQIGKQIRTDFEITNIPTPVRSWNSHKIMDNCPWDNKTTERYTVQKIQSRGKLFHKIHAQVVTRTLTVKRDRENSIKYENLIRIKTITSAMIQKHTC